MALTANFTPCATRSDIVIASGGVAPAAVVLPATGNSSFCAYNGTTTVAYLAFGASTVAATTASPYFVAPGAIMLFGIPITATHVSGISATTGTITGAAGEGS